jgi:hypothetical protein
MTVSFEEGWSKEVKIGFKEKIYACKQGDVKEFYL